tara:strand:- start:551 stop:1219 length:669 start_codon:yes stop_codon:yes gene_type:complete
MDIVEEKGIEKVDEPKVEVVEKKRKPRSEAQKAAFEKARLKRAENLAKKKLEEDSVAIARKGTGNERDASSIVVDDNPGNHPNPTPTANSPEVRPKAPPKKRGRPKGSKKLKREPVPEVGQPNFLPQVHPPEAGDIRYQYQQPNPYQQFNPMMMYQNQPPPQVHNYYYGHQQGAVHQQPREQPPQRPPSPEVESSEEEDEVQDYLQYPEETYQEPVLKFRFA